MILCEDFKVRAPVPQFNKDGSRWETSKVETHEIRSWSNATGSDILVSTKAKPLEKIKITVNHFAGRITQLPFRASLCYELKSGAIFSFPVEGEYDWFSYTEMDPQTKVIAKWNETTNSWKEV